MESLAKHITEWLSRKKVCVVFQDAISRVWPIAETEDAKKRDAEIQEWARCHGWKAKIKDMGIRVTFTKLTDLIPDPQPPADTPAELAGSAVPRALSKRAPARAVNTPSVAIVNAAADSGPVKSEDLLPKRLAKQLREGKKRFRK